MSSRSRNQSIAGKLRGIEQELHSLLTSFPLRGHMVTKRERTWQPATDVCETPTHFLIRVEIPGVTDPEHDIDLLLDENLLIIRGQRADRCREQKLKVHQMEIHYGLFERSILLPRTIDGDAAESALYVDGFLVVKIPKSEVEHAATVKIRVSFQDRPSEER